MPFRQVAVDLRLLKRMRKPLPCREMTSFGLKVLPVTQFIGREERSCLLGLSHLRQLPDVGKLAHVDARGHSTPIYETPILMNASAHSRRGSVTTLPQLDDVVVLIPAYNCQDDLLRTLASLVEEAPVKVLVVDDGSTPPIEAPALANLQVELLRLPSNQGIELALRTGCEYLLQRGVRFIARIDAGDIAVAGRLARQRQVLDRHPEIGAVGAWAEAVSPAGQSLFVCKPPTDPARIRRLRFVRSCFIHPALMLRAEALARVGNYRANYPAAEDLDLLLRIMQHYDCSNLAEIGVRFALNEQGISSTRRRRQIISTLKLQWSYFEPMNPYDWLGWCKHGLHLIVPYRALQRIKRMVLPQ